MFLRAPLSQGLTQDQIFAYPNFIQFTTKRARHTIDTRSEPGQFSNHVPFFDNEQSLTELSMKVFLIISNEKILTEKQFQCRREQALARDPPTCLSLDG